MVRWASFALGSSCNFSCLSFHFSWYSGSYCVPLSSGQRKVEIASLSPPLSTANSLTRVVWNGQRKMKERGKKGKSGRKKKHNWKCRMLLEFLFTPSNWSRYGVLHSSCVSCTYVPDSDVAFCGRNNRLKNNNEPNDAAHTIIKIVSDFIFHSFNIPAQTLLHIRHAFGVPGAVLWMIERCYNLNEIMAIGAIIIRISMRSKSMLSIR